jgi:adenylyltransferase/sulfurtransferase
MKLTNQEISRYSRHLNLPEFGLDAQQKLKDASVLVVGTGGLGAPLLQYLTAAGVGKIGVVDFDVVDTSNLQRQVLFGTSTVGQQKTTTAITRLKDLNPHVEFIEHQVQLTSVNAMDIIPSYDVVADGTDNFPTRYLVNDACVLAGKPNVYASIFQFEGQVSVFNYTNAEGILGPNYRDLFPVQPPPGMVPSCAEGGVLGVLPGIIGSMQASEVIKVITGIGDTLAGRLFLFDARTFTSRVVNVRRDPNNPLNGENPTISNLIDYEEFCGIKTTDIKEITVNELNNWFNSGKEVVLIDVREDYEYQAANMNGILIPQDEIEKRLDEIPHQGKVVIHCRSGARSARAIEMLRDTYGYHNLYNLKGGILAWRDAYAPDLVVV